MADHSVKTSNRQMTGFFRHDRFSPGNCVIGILRVYIYIYVLIYDVFTNMKTEKNTQRHKGSFF